MEFNYLVAMVLNNLRTALSDEPVSIRVTNGKIAQILPGFLQDKSVRPNFDFDGAIIFPGLINSHDHLDFNLFPALGGPTYCNYTEWGGHIHQAYKDKIVAVLKVPEQLRIQWGIYKNLLCGVTTVVNHGKKIIDKTSLLTIYQDCQSIHSVQFEKKWKQALNNPLKNGHPVVIHTGEGSDRAAIAEVDRLIKWNLLKRPIIAVHGVAMNEAQAKNFRALVWCPESNYFLLNQTAAVNRLKKHLPILFGTDSTLTGNWNIWDHIALARKTKFLTDEELFDAATGNAAAVWKLNAGKIAEGRDADLVIAKRRQNQSPADAFFSIEPKDIRMVIHRGKITLFDESLSSDLQGLNLFGYSAVHVNGALKFVQGDLPELMHQIKQYYPEVNFPVNR